MSRRGGNPLGTILLLAVIAIVAVMLVKWIEGQKTSSKNASGVGSGTASSAGPSLASFIKNAFARLKADMAVSQGNAMIKNLPTSLPQLTSLLPTQDPLSLSQSFMNSLSFPVGSFSVGSLSPTDPSVGSLLPTQPTQSLNLNNFAFTPTY